MLDCVDSIGGRGQHSALRFANTLAAKRLQPSHGHCSRRRRKRLRRRPGLPRRQRPPDAFPGSGIEIANAGTLRRAWKFRCHRYCSVCQQIFRRKVEGDRQVPCATCHAGVVRPRTFGKLAGRVVGTAKPRKTRPWLAAWEPNRRRSAKS